MNKVEQIIDESFNLGVPYVLDEKASTPIHKYYLFSVNGNNYRINIARIGPGKEKTAFLFTLGSLTPKGNMTQFKYVAADIRQVISTAIEIFQQWHETYKNIFTSIIFRLPNKITPPQIKLAERIIKKRKIKNLEKLPLTGIEDAKNKYIFYKNTKKGDDVIIKGLQWKSIADYGFYDAFPAELVDAIVLKTKATKSHLVKQLILLNKGFEGEEESAAVNIFKKLNPQELKVLEQKEKAIQKVVVEENVKKKVTREGKKEENITEEQLAYHWKPSIGVSKKIEILNKFLFKLNQKPDGLPSLIKFLSTALDEKNKNDQPSYKYISLFLEAFADSLNWELQDDKNNDEFFRTVFFSVPSEYIKYLTYHNEHIKSQQLYTPYTFWAAKKLSTGKLGIVKREDIIKDATIAGFFSRFTSLLASEGPGFFKMENVAVRYFTSLFDRWDYVKLLRDEIQSGNEPDWDKKIVENNVNTETYYKKTVIDKAFEKLTTNADMTVLEFIDLKNVQEPQPKNSIFNENSIEEETNALHKIQAKKSGSGNYEGVSTIRNYTGTLYNFYNTGFRNEDIMKTRQSELLKFIKQYKENAIKLPYDLTVSRHINYPTAIELDKTYVGFSPLSTSLDNTVFDGKNLNLMIKIPKGSMVFAALKSFSYIPDEKEIILPPGTILKPYRKSIMKATNTRWVECMVMGNVLDYVETVVKEINDVKIASDVFELEEDRRKNYLRRGNFILNEMYATEEEPEVPKSKEEEMEAEVLFSGSQKIVDKIKSGEIKPDYSFLIDNI